MQFKDDPRSPYLILQVIMGRCRHEKLRTPSGPWLDSQNIVHDIWHFNMFFNGEVTGWRTQMQSGVRLWIQEAGNEQ